MSFGPALNRVRRVVPQPLKSALARARDYLLDRFDAVTGQRDDLTPPRRLSFVGGGDFRKVGEEFRRYFVELGGLTPDQRVLDVGCGIGRMAVPLTRYLSARGSYDGFDIVPAGIAWCQSRITARFPNFRFQLADIHNSTYNPGGRSQAEAYRFPYDDGGFDLVVLTSVFTHLLPHELRRYLTECARVLRPGGRLFGTFLLLNPESLDLIARGQSRLDFQHDLGEYRVVHADDPAAAVGYPEQTIRDWLAVAGLSLHEPVHYGAWCGRDRHLSYQDIVVATRMPG